MTMTHPERHVLSRDEVITTRRVIVGGCFLAFLSAAVNAGFLIHMGTSVSHLSGDVARVGVDVIRSYQEMTGIIANLVTATGGFVTGAAAAGYFIHHPEFTFARPYGRSVAVIGVCLILAHLFLERAPIAAVLLASFACGLQNALATHYRGVILRTTHLTGLLTDLGSNIGMRLKGHAIDPWRIGIPASLAAFFFLGAAFGSALILWWNLPFLLILAGLYISGGLGWTVYKHWFRGRAGSRQRISK
jgi:uncharacterized membrane protein YoaK (UPF0700 family)